MDKLEERLRYTAAILDANASKFAVPDHIPQKAATLREAADALAAKQALIDELVDGLKPFAKIPLCYPRLGSQPQQAELEAPAPGSAYTATDVVRARKLLP